MISSVLWMTAMVLGTVWFHLVYRWQLGFQRLYDFICSIDERCSCQKDRCRPENKDYIYQYCAFSSVSIFVLLSAFFMHIHYTSFVELSKFNWTITILFLLITIPLFAKFSLIGSLYYPPPSFHSVLCGHWATHDLFSQLVLKFKM